MAIVRMKYADMCHPVNHSESLSLPGDTLTSNLEQVGCFNPFVCLENNASNIRHLILYMIPTFKFVIPVANPKLLQGGRAINFLGSCN